MYKETIFFSVLLYTFSPLALLTFYPDNLYINRSTICMCNDLGALGLIDNPEYLIRNENAKRCSPKLEPFQHTLVFVCALVCSFLCIGMQFSRYSCSLLTWRWQAPWVDFTFFRETKRMDTSVRDGDSLLDDYLDDEEQKQVRWQIYDRL